MATKKTANWKLTVALRAKFCTALAESGIVSSACRKAEISRTAAYEARNADPVFAEAWDKALEVGIAGLEDEAQRRAFEGVLEPVFQGGAKVGAIRKYSDTLAMFMLKAHKPDRYRERHDLSLSGSLDLQTANEAELRAELARLQAALPPPAPADDGETAG